MRLRVVLVCCALSLVVAGSASAATLPFAASSGALSLLLENRTASKTATAALQKTTVTMAAAAAITPAPAFTSTELSTTPGANWLTNGGDVNNARYSSLNQINTSNVANLKEAWHIHLDGSGMASKYSAEATPLVYNGVMYIPTGNSDVFAARRGDRRAALDLPVEYRPDRQHGVLRVGQPRCRARRRQDLRRAARRPPRRAQPDDGRGRLEDRRVQLARGRTP